MEIRDIKKLIAPHSVYGWMFFLGLPGRGASPKAIINNNPIKIGWGCEELHPAALPHHRTCGFPYPAIEQGGSQFPDAAKSHGMVNPYLLSVNDGN